MINNNEKYIFTLSFVSLSSFSFCGQKKINKYFKSILFNVIHSALYVKQEKKETKK
jgi:hypothetical protein